MKRLTLIFVISLTHLVFAISPSFARPDCTLNNVTVTITPSVSGTDCDIYQDGSGRYVVTLTQDQTVGQAIEWEVRGTSSDHIRFVLVTNTSNYPVTCLGKPEPAGMRAFGVQSAQGALDETEASRNGRGDPEAA